MEMINVTFPASKILKSMAWFYKSCRKIKQLFFFIIIIREEKKEIRVVVLIELQQGFMK